MNTVTAHEGNSAGQGCAGKGTLLLLGGTTEGYRLAADIHNPDLNVLPLLQSRGVQVVSSLAGRTASPRLPEGESRVGGFGGVAGLTDWLRQNRAVAVIDATHPFASRMGHHAAEACAACGIPLLRLERPVWQPQAGDRWIEVDSWEQAAAAIPPSTRVLLAIGRQELEHFVPRRDCFFLIRSVDAPEAAPSFAAAGVLLARGPFSLDSERQLLQQQRLQVIVCKNSGGSATDSKLEAARQLGVTVVMLRRPPRPDSPRAASVSQALDWIVRLFSPNETPAK